MNDLWCTCGGARRYVVEHYRQWQEEQGPTVKVCMCATWHAPTVSASHRFKTGTDSNFYRLLDDGRVVACEPFAPHVHRATRRAAA